VQEAAFDEFVGLLAGDAQDFDHVIFDTAPTGRRWAMNHRQTMLTGGAWSRAWSPSERSSFSPMSRNPHPATLNAAVGVGL
jgi:anion-transporting  ArsA/GET3 family ATPase